jgi:hypothetical protein
MAKQQQHIPALERKVIASFYQTIHKGEGVGSKYAEAKEFLRNSAMV